MGLVCAALALLVAAIYLYLRVNRPSALSRLEAFAAADSHTPRVTALSWLVYAALVMIPLLFLYTGSPFGDHIEARAKKDPKAEDYCSTWDDTLRSLVFRGMVSVLASATVYLFHGFRSAT